MGIYLIATIWIQQHYVLYEPTFSANDKEPTINTYKKSLQGSNAGLWFNDMMEVIGDQTLFPTWCERGVRC